MFRLNYPIIYNINTRNKCKRWMRLLCIEKTSCYLNIVGTVFCHLRLWQIWLSRYLPLIQKQKLLETRVTLYLQKTSRAKRNWGTMLREYKREKNKDINLVHKTSKMFIKIFGCAKSLEGNDKKHHYWTPSKMGSNDILRNGDFYIANAIIITAKCKLKFSRKSDNTHYPTIDKFGLQSLYTNIRFSPKTPIGLLNEAQLDSTFVDKDPKI